MSGELKDLQHYCGTFIERLKHLKVDHMQDKMGLTVYVRINCRLVYENNTIDQGL